MDNSNSLSSSILQSSEVSLPSSSVASTSLSGDDSGFFDSLKNINMTTWLIIILILAFLGFNIFVYLAKGTQDISNFFAPFLEKIFGTGTSTVGQVVDVSAEGAKAVVSGAANVVNTGLTDVQNITPGGLNANSSLPNQSIKSSIPQPDVTQNNALNKALNSQQNSNDYDYEAHQASSSIHSGGTGQAGWCYIGEDRGYRSCAKVGANDTCMSGYIFPTNELCINPNLRP
jgi:hypothetical protein